MTSPGLPGDVHFYVWKSEEIFHRRYQRGLDAAEALATVLEETKLLGGREDWFLELYRQCMALDAQSVSTAWLDPAAFGWAVYTYHSVGVLSALRADLAAGKDVRADHDFVEGALIEHLAFFKALAVGMHIVAGVDFALDEPLDVTPAFAIPATRYVIQGVGSVSLLGARNGKPHFRGDAHIVEAPLVTSRNCHFQLNSWCGQIPHIDCDEVAIAARLPATIEPVHLEAIDRAIEWVQLYAPDMFEGFRKWTRCLAVKQPKGDGTGGGVGSGSFTFLPGLIHLKLVFNPLWLAESFVHESMHNRLFFLDEDTHILRDIPGPAIHYSPWRPDRRPPHGIMHAITVFIPVTRFMFEIHRAGVLDGDDQAYALDFVVRQLFRIRIAIEVLESVAEFTDAGRIVFDEIKRSAAELDREIVHANLPQDGIALQIDKPTSRFVPSLSERDGAPMSSIEALLEHIDLYDRAAQATEARAMFEDMLARRQRSAVAG